jgi:acetylornithine/N-succinyldiaminopimelate aminotransferase
MMAGLRSGAEYASMSARRGLWPRRVQSISMGIVKDMTQHTTTEELLAAGERTNSPSYGPAPVILDHGEGMYVVDSEGRRYLDFLAGIAVNSLGYSHPKLVETLRAQAGRLLHVSNMFYTAEQIRLMERLCAGSIADRVFLCNSGAEANEAALKLARRYQSVVQGKPERFEFITMKSSFHGRTYGAITATGQPKYHKGFEPMLPGFVYGTFNDLEDITSLVGPHTAAIMVEPVQGEGGVTPATREFLSGLRALCDAHGLVLIFDEVQAGIGRLGTLHAYESFGVEPDIITWAKGLGGGVPIGAMGARAHVFEGFERGSHATTFGGNPLVSSAALCVLDVIEQDGLCQRAREQGARLMEGLRGLAARHPGVLLEVRGMGLMVGLQCAGSAAGEIAGLCREEGLLVNTAGGDTLRMVPPLIVEASHVDEALACLERAVKRWEEGAA